MAYGTVVQLPLTIHNFFRLLKEIYLMYKLRFELRGVVWPINHHNH
jgi:hypothetical protein